MGARTIAPGTNFGYLTCFKKTGEYGAGGSVWLCRCICGCELSVSEAMLVSGVKRSCGCRKNKILNLKGSKFGKLTVLEPVPERGMDGSVMWLCRCDCGNYKICSANKLRMGSITNCGCAVGEAAYHSKTFIDGTCVEIMLSDKIFSSNTSGYRGVAKKNERWQAYINYGGRRKHLGIFDTKEEAARVRSLEEEKIREHLNQLMNEGGVKGEL